MYIWESHACYDPERLAVDLERIRVSDIRSIVIGREGHPLAAFLIGGGSLFAAVNLPYLIGAMNGSFSMSDYAHDDVLNTASLFGLAGGCLAILVDEFFSRDVTRAIGRSEDYESLLRDLLRSAMLFRDGYPPEFAAVLSRRRVK